MPIHYGEITIIYKKEETLYTNLLTWLDNNTPASTTKYIFLFDDGEICEYGDKKRDTDFKILHSDSSAMPLFFQNELYNRVYINKKTSKEQNFNALFSLYPKYDHSSIIDSEYNSIYYCHKPSSDPDIFGIIRIRSNECMPRFQFAYDSDEFTKDEIICLTHIIFTQLDEQRPIQLTYTPK